MSLATKVLAVNNNLPIRAEQAVHSGKVRSVYWLTAADSRRLIEQKGYDVAADAELAVMVISDRISAFECIWHGEGGMHGVPAKVLRLMRFPITGLNYFVSRIWPTAIFWIFPILWFGLCKRPSQ